MLDTPIISKATSRLALRHDYAQLRRATLGGFLAPAFRLLPAQSNDPRSASAGVEADRLPVVRKGIRMRTRLADDADEFRVDLGSVPGPRQSRGLHHMSDHACRLNLAPGLDQRSRVVPDHDVGSSDKRDESRLCRD